MKAIQDIRKIDQQITELQAKKEKALAEVQQFAQRLPEQIADMLHEKHCTQYHEDYTCMYYEEKWNALPDGYSIKNEYLKRAVRFIELTEGLNADQYIELLDIIFNPAE